MDISTFDATRLTFGPKRDKYVSTTVDTGFPRLVLGTDEMPLRAPFGVSTPFSGDADSDRLTFDLEIDDELKSALTAIDEQVVAAAVAKSQEWFGKVLTKEAIQAMHMPLVQPPKKEEYKAMVRTKFSLKRDKETTVYVPKGGGVFRMGGKGDIAKNSEVRVQVALSSVMIGNRQFGVSLTCEQVMIMAAPEVSVGIGVFGEYVVEGA